MNTQRRKNTDYVTRYLPFGLIFGLLAALLFDFEVGYGLAMGLFVAILFGALVEINTRRK